MIDVFDYKEPSCVLCDGKEFYNPKQGVPDGRIPVDRVISKVDDFFNKNDFEGAGRLLEYWLNEAISLKDTAGELSVRSELVGFYRKTNQKDKGLVAVQRALELVRELNQENMASGATIMLNCATAYKAFDMPNEAIILYERAEKVYKKVLSEKDERFGGLYNNMALTLVDLQRFDQAISAYNKAISVMKEVENGGVDLAITYVNMAHLYEVLEEKERITDCLFSAYNLLCDENLQRNGYFAYVCSKSAPSFEYFGYQFISEELKRIAGDIYERS